MSEWIRSADGKEGDIMPEKPMPVTPPVQPLNVVDQNRPIPPANPTGAPGQKPLPLNEVVSLIQGSGKAMIDAGLNIEKAAVGMQKIVNMARVTESDMALVNTAEKFFSKISGAKESLAALVRDMQDFGAKISNPGAQQKPVADAWIGK